MLFPLAIIFALAVLEVTSSSPTSYSVHESRDSVHERWIRKGRVQPNAILPVRIGLTQNNLDKGHDHLMSVSDPTSPQYGQHWTSEEVVDFFRPDDTTIDAVREWLESSGISNATISGNKGWLAFNRPAIQIEALLHTEYYLFEDQYTGAVAVSCESYSVPTHLHGHVDYITPGLRLLAPNRADTRNSQKAKALTKTQSSSKSTDDLGNCDYIITPACIAALYGIPPSRLTPNPSNKMGIYAEQAQRWDQSDLDIFFTRYTNGRVPNGTAPINHAIDGGHSQSNHSTDHAVRFELLLDLDVSFPIVYPQSIVVWDENDLYYQEKWGHNDTYSGFFNQLLDAIDGSYCTYSAYGETGNLPGVDPSYPDPQPHGGYNHSLECGVFKPPNVISFSYGGQEADMPIAYQLRQCNEFLKLGLQGVSFLFASGDGGVAQEQYESKLPHKTGCLGSNSNYTVFNPAFPVTCPYVTAVGGTMVLPGHSVLNESQPESVLQNLHYTDINSFASGGGFSNLYPRPDYQASAVEKYLTEYNPPYPYYSRLAQFKPNPATIDINSLQGTSQGLYNRVGRAFPDVAANALHLATIVGGELVKNGGTSQSTPTFSSIINRINEERLAAGKTPVGFINPVLYRNPSVMNDVTNGSNPGCLTSGFKAAPGWDPATGLGTPNYKKMLDLFMSLP